MSQLYLIVKQHFSVLSISITTSNDGYSLSILIFLIVFCVRNVITSFLLSPLFPFR